MNVAELAINWEWGDLATGYTVIHVQKSDNAAPWSEANLERVARAVAEWWGAPNTGEPALCSLYTEQLVLHEIVAKRIRPDLSADVVYPVGSPGTWETDFEFGIPIPIPWKGTSYELEFEVGGHMHPPQVCWCITLHTTSSGRSGRGRLFLPACRQRASIGPDSWPDPDEDAAGLVPEAIISRGMARVANLKSEISLAHPPGEPWAWSVFSRKNNDSYGVTNFSWSRILRTQRGRAVDVGWWVDFDTSAQTWVERTS